MARVVTARPSDRITSAVMTNRRYLFRILKTKRFKND
jgi:hypothetical protein